MDKKVFILILNWNGWQDTVECVRSCEKLDYSDFKIVVIDNGSDDESLQQLHTALADHEIIETGTNLGFAGGNNIGIRHALKNGAAYIWLLNNDTIVDPAALTELVKTAEDDGQTGIVGSKILTYSDPSVLHFAGGKVNLINGETEHLGAWEKDAGQYDDLSVVDYVTGCSLLIKKEVVENIGLMPEEYFLYYEETDWCLRAKKAGYTIRMAPTSKILHKISASINFFSSEKVYYITRNRLYFLKKYGKEIQWKNRAFTDLGNLYYFLKTGKLKSALMVLKSYNDWFFKRYGMINRKL